MILWRDIKDFVLSFYYPKGQYFLVSFPKTGRTWLIYMLNQIKDLSTNFDDKTQSNILTELDKVKHFDSKGLKELYDLL